MSVKETQPWISSGNVSSIFSLTSRYWRRLSLPISFGMLRIWFRSSQRTLRLCSLPTSAGISSISLLPRSRDSSLAMLHKEFGMDLRRLSRPWSDRKLTKLVSKIGSEIRSVSNSVRIKLGMLTLTLADEIEIWWDLESIFYLTIFKKWGSERYCLSRYCITYNREFYLNMDEIKTLFKSIIWHPELI